MTDHEYTYRLRRDDDGGPAVRFVYADAPAPHEDDTVLRLNRPSWEALGSPEGLRMILRPAP